MNDMNWLAIYPELVLLAMALVVSMVDLWAKTRGPAYWLTQLTLAVVAAMHFAYIDTPANYAMQDMEVSDSLGHLRGFFAAQSVLISLVYARPYAAEREMLKGELFSLSLFSLLGISVMLSANNFLVMYLGLVLMSLSLYALLSLIHI